MSTHDAPQNTPPSRPRRWVTGALFAGAALTILGALAAQRRGALAGAPRPPLPPPRPPVAAPPTPIAPVQAAARPRVELVFALDTTGSMTGLIEGAKRKIWSLASFVARGQPTPDLRVGLIAYRDVGDAYVTRVHDLDDDLDRVYARLRQFHADGGGDTPEHVSRALHEAVHRMSWTDRQEVVRVIYLVGDAPPHTDYDDGFDYLAAARTAHQKGIQVHTIRCGGDPTTETSWRRIATLGHGQYMTIHQDGGMREERTPYDEELARLHDRLSGTAIGYGAGAGGVRASVAAAAEAPMEVKAARAGFLARKMKAVGGKGDLLEEMESGTVELDKVKDADLPADLRSLDAPARRARIVEKQNERNEIQRKITEVSSAREKHLETAKKEGSRADGFDDMAKKSLQKTVADNPKAGFKL